MHRPENQIHYQLRPGAGLINPEIIPTHPHPSFFSSSYYAPLSDVVCDHRDGIPEDRTVAALRKHKESEKQRRTRINSHLDKLRRLLHCNPKIDKATLLAKVVQRMRELKRQTSDITALGIFPSEYDEISFLSCDDCYTKEHLRCDQGLVFKVSLCCEDRSDLLTDVMEVLNSLHLKVQKAELSTIGGRIRNVLFVTVNKDQSVESIQFLQNSLKTLLGRAQRSKRRRMLDRKIVI